jgi:CRISPR/Cas system-associated exonuclease Cas4 (RecB family)
MEQIYELVNDIMNKVKDLYVLKRRELTVTSLASCLRMSYYHITQGKSISEKMVVGTEHHAFFQRHFTDLLQQRGSICWPEYEVKYWKLKGRADLFCINQDGIGIIFEFKFTALPYKSNPFYPFWYRQLKYYVVLEKITSGHETIGVLIASSFALDKWVVDVVEVENPLEVVREMDRRYQELEEALAKNTPPVPERGKWCEYCAWKNLCLNQQLV